MHIIYHFLKIQIHPRLHSKLALVLRKWRVYKVRIELDLDWEEFQSKVQFQLKFFKEFNLSCKTQHYHTLEIMSNTFFNQKWFLELFWLRRIAKYSGIDSAFNWLAWKHKILKRTKRQYSSRVARKGTGSTFGMCESLLNCNTTNKMW